MRAFRLSVLVSGSGAWRLVSNKLSLAALRIFVAGFFGTRFRMVVHSQGIIHFVFSPRVTERRSETRYHSAFLSFNARTPRRLNQGGRSHKHHLN